MRITKMVLNFNEYGFCVAHLSAGDSSPFFPTYVVYKICHIICLVSHSSYPYYLLSVGEKLQKKQDHKSFRMEQALTS